MLFKTYQLEKNWFTFDRESVAFGAVDLKGTTSNRIFFCNFRILDLSSLITRYAWKSDTKLSLEAAR